MFSCHFQSTCCLCAHPLRVNFCILCLQTLFLPIHKTKPRLHSLEQLSEWGQSQVFHVPFGSLMKLNGCQRDSMQKHSNLKAHFHPQQYCKGDLLMTACYRQSELSLMIRGSLELDNLGTSIWYAWILFTCHVMQFPIFEENPVLGRLERISWLWVCGLSKNCLICRTESGSYFIL